MRIQAELSLYPLKTDDVTTVIFQFVETLRGAGLEAETGPLSTLLTGEHDLVFAALAQAFATIGGDRVLVAKFVARRG